MSSLTENISHKSVKEYELTPHILFQKNNTDNNPNVHPKHSSKDLQKFGSAFFPAVKNLFKINKKTLIFVLSMLKS